MRLVETCRAAAFAAVVFAAPAAAQALEPEQRARMLTRFSEADEIQLRDIAGLVRVIPENRTDIAIGYVNAGVTPTPEYRVSRRRLIVDGCAARFAGAA